MLNHKRLPEFVLEASFLQSTIQNLPDRDSCHTAKDERKHFTQHSNAG